MSSNMYHKLYYSYTSSVKSIFKNKTNTYVLIYISSFLCTSCTIYNIIYFPFFNINIFQQEHFFYVLIIKYFALRTK